MFIVDTEKGEKDLAELLLGIHELINGLTETTKEQEQKGNGIRTSQDVAQFWTQVTQFSYDLQGILFHLSSVSSNWSRNVKKE